jgi:hypothetical protein
MAVIEEYKIKDLLRYFVLINVLLNDICVTVRTKCYSIEGSFVDRTIRRY